MVDQDALIGSLLHDPIKIDYEEVTARQLLSGQVTLPYRYGQGMLNKIVIKDGLILSKNVKVSFAPYKEELFFHVRDRLLIETILELVRNKLDQLTSHGHCIKPLYSKPKGFIGESGRPDNPLYTFELDSIIKGNSVSLPYYLYINNSDGSTLANAIPVLARRINIHVYDDVYLQFKPNNITIPEVISICKSKFEQSKALIYNTYWGLYNDEPNQPCGGVFKKTLYDYEFKLIDLLSRKSYLPVTKLQGKYYLSQNISIGTTGGEYKFSVNTPLETLWNKWKTISADTECKCSEIYTNLCIYRVESILDGTEVLPSVKGVVLKKKIVVKLGENVLCYPSNTLIQDILWTLHRIFKSNNTTASKYSFIHQKTHQKVQPKTIYTNIFVILKDYTHTITDNIVLKIDSSHLPLHISSGTSLRELQDKYRDLMQEVHRHNKLEESRYKMWLHEEKKTK